ncbi:IS982 family transposase [Parashewanella curva]|uniref:IS982 family transposase n=1 Tax=Parashewanella curva TaxID=2338552 RepID=UPI00140543FF|nr:IS982 family transposase [Parashewanella curva]
MPSVKGITNYGFCASKQEHYYGFKGHLVTDERGIPLNFSVAPANIDERDVAYEVLDKVIGLTIGDKGLIRPSLKADLLQVGLNLQTPLRKNMLDKRPPEIVRLLLKVRRRIETTIGQLVEYFEIEKIRC